MKKLKDKYRGQIRIEYVPPIQWEGDWIGPGIKMVHIEDLRKLYDYSLKSKMRLSQ